MKIGFFIFILAFTLLMVGYVTFKGWQILQIHSTARVVYLIANIALFLTMLIGLMLQGSMPQPLAKAVTFVGYSYMIVMIYLLLSFAILDIVRLSNLIFHFAPKGMLDFRFWWLMGTFVVISVAMIFGNYKFNHPEIVHLDIQAENSHQNKKMRIVAASDIHLGVSIDKKRLKKYVELINAQEPDIVLLAGDVSDRSTIPLVEQKMAEEFRQIIAPLGVYAISGNHEHFSENPFATGNYLETAGVHVLRDTSMLVDSCFYIIGRDDRVNPQRKPLADIMKGLRADVPKILLDHQPFDLHQAQENGVDLQISGHTHNGQFFPGNLIVKKMYELGHGYKQKGKTHYYVSSGLGIWGPQYRIGSQSELVVIDFAY
jgi:uncharacterized protein